jgi:hypothetical protein
MLNSSYSLRITDVFNNREIAVGIWVSLFFIWIFTKKDFRDKLSKLMASFTSGIILIPILLMIIYVMIVVWALEELGLWRITQLKDTILWIIFSGLAMEFQLADQKEAHSIKRVLKNNIKLIIFFEFVVNVYSFPLVIEIILFPILVIVSCITVMAKYDSKYSSAETFAKLVLSLVGTGIIIYVVINIISDYKNIISTSTLQDILLPVILTIVLMPFIYMLMIYIAYETLSVRLKIHLRDSDKLQKYAMKKLIVKCKLNLTKVQKALGENSYLLFDAKSQEDIDRIIFEKSATI